MNRRAIENGAHLCLRRGLRRKTRPWSMTTTRFMPSSALEYSAGVEAAVGAGFSSPITTRTELMTFVDARAILLVGCQSRGRKDGGVGVTPNHFEPKRK
jgi:hypothetical protein